MLIEGEPVYHPNRCTNKCVYTGASEWTCFHLRYIGRDGDCVGLTEMEKEFVKRMGCARYKSKTVKL